MHGTQIALQVLERRLHALRERINVNLLYYVRIAIVIGVIIIILICSLRAPASFARLGSLTSFLSKKPRCTEA